MNYLLQVVGNLQVSTLIITIAALAFLWLVGKKSYHTITAFHDDIQEREKFIRNVGETLNEVKDEQIAMKKVIDALSENQQRVEQRQEIAEKKMQARELNKLRDRLIQSYRYYTSNAHNPLQKWSEMEASAFYSLYRDYKSLNGNSYIDETVKPAVDLLTIVFMDDTDGLAELANSRKG